jgi:hypothetical protein
MQNYQIQNACKISDDEYQCTVQIIDGEGTVLTQYENYVVHSDDQYSPFPNLFSVVAAMNPPSCE